MRVETKIFVLLFGLAALTACGASSLQGDRLFEKGDLAGAAEAYQQEAAQSWGGLSERALFREAQAWGLPSSPVRDPARAEGVLEEQLRRFPSGRLAEPARVFRAFLKEEQASAASLAQTQKALGEAKKALEDARSKGDALETAASKREEECARLLARAEEQERTIARLQEELEKLKRIDLGQPR